MKRRSFLLASGLSSGFLISQAFWPDRALQAGPTGTFNPPTPPPTPPLAGTSRGAGDRGLCRRVSDQLLTAFVPQVQAATKQTFVWGQTTMERPTLWFYIPYDGSDEIDLVIRDSNQKELARERQYLSGLPGVVEIRLPYALKVGQSYFWLLDVNCDRTPDGVSGWIQRVALAPAIARKLATQTPEQQVLTYASAGIWHDALSTVGRARRKNPQNPQLAKLWSTLLTEGGFGTLATQPIVQ